MVNSGSIPLRTTNQSKLNMNKVRDNYIAELIIASIISIMLLTSCGSAHSVCPSYGKGVTEAELGSDMYANQEWDKE